MDLFRGSLGALVQLELEEINVDVCLHYCIQPVFERKINEGRFGAYNKWQIRLSPASPVALAYLGEFFEIINN